MECDYYVNSIKVSKEEFERKLEELKQDIKNNYEKNKKNLTVIREWRGVFVGYKNGEEYYFATTTAILFYGKTTLTVECEYETGKIAEEKYLDVFDEESVEYDEVVLP